jgi:serine protease Do
MPFPIESLHAEPESDFLIQDPSGLRKAVTPVFAFDLQDGMLKEPRDGLSIGLGTSFYITPFGRQLSAMHVTTDFFNAQNTVIRPSPEKNLLQPKDSWIGIYQDPGLVYGMTKAGEVLLATDFVMFPVDQTKHPLAFTFPPERLRHIEPTLDLSAWDILQLGNRKTVYLPIRVGCRPSVAEGDRVLAVGYPEIKSWKRPGAQLVTFQEQMRGSFGRVLKLDRTWEHDRKVWPTITVEAHWKPGMSGGPVFNENCEVVGIVSRGVDAEEGTPAWSSALWLEALPFAENIYGCIDPLNPGWILGWGVCNEHSLVELFQTQEKAEAFVRTSGSSLSVRKCSMPHYMRFTRPDATPRARGR